MVPVRLSRVWACMMNKLVGHRELLCLEALAEAGGEQLAKPSGRSPGTILRTGWLSFILAFLAWWRGAQTVLKELFSWVWCWWLVETSFYRVGRRRLHVLSRQEDSRECSATVNPERQAALGATSLQSLPWGPSSRDSDVTLCYPGEGFPSGSQEWMLLTLWGFTDTLQEGGLALGHWG